jgi:hypothetical protein
VLNHLLALLGGVTTLLSNDVTKHQVDLPGHVGGITTDVEVGLLFEKLADKRGVLLEAVLDVYLLGTLPGKGSDNLQGVTKLLLVGLMAKKLVCLDVKGRRSSISYLPFIAVDEVLVLLTTSEE